MLSKSELIAIPADILMEKVYQAKALEARSICAKGRMAQIEYLTGEDSIHFRAEQCRLAGLVYEAVFNETETFTENELGSDLAYLLGAIIRNKVIEWWRSELPVLHEILVKKFPTDHPIWGHIAIHNDASVELDDTE